METRGCGYQADSSDLAAWAAGAATYTPSLLQRRSDRCLLLTISPAPAGDQDSVCLRYATHSPLAGPGFGCPQCWLANCDGPCLPPTHDSLTLRRYATHSPSLGRGVGYPQCWLRPTAVHPFLRSVTHSTLRRAAWLAAGADSAGQGLTV